MIGDCSLDLGGPSRKAWLWNWRNWLVCIDADVRRAWKAERWRTLMEEHQTNMYRGYKMKEMYMCDYLVCSIGVPQV